MIKFFKKDIYRGFSLIELLIVIAIISVLALVVIVNYEEGRAQARDELRITHIEQLSAALRLYKEKYGDWPQCGDGMRIDVGGDVDWYSMDAPNGVEANRGLHPQGDPGVWCVDWDKVVAFLYENFEEIPVDPLGPGNRDYYYYFDTGHHCNTMSYTSVVVFAANMEVQPSNKNEVCSLAGGHDGGFLETSVHYGGTKDPSAPYVVTISHDR